MFRCTILVFQTSIYEENNAHLDHILELTISVPGIRCTSTGYELSVEGEEGLPGQIVAGEQPRLSCPQHVVTVDTVLTGLRGRWCEKL